jgi:ATP-binding cassette subfamily F protein 3
LLMAILTASNLAMRFGPHDVFSSLNLSIHHGERAAIVGPNGRGKTTLLRILAGRETPTEGEVFRARGVKIGYLRQEAALLPFEGTLLELADEAFADLKAQAVELARLEKALATDPSLLEKYGQAQAAFELAGGYNYELIISQVLTGLGFDETDYYKSIKHFSGGQQTRAQLARLLLERPGLLLLDEPTNHLDLEAVEWLENYLSSWAGAVVVVSHDRYFLDKVANRVWELFSNNLELYRGNYSHYLQQRAGRWARSEKEYKRQQTFIAKEEDFIRRNLAGQRTKQAQGRRKRLERLKRDDLIKRRTKDKTMRLRLNADLRSGDLVLATHDLAIGYPGGEVLISFPDLEIRRGDCVALLGPNGSGKTTFLKTILKEIPSKAGRIRIGAAVETGYFAQIQTELNLENSVLDELLLVNHNMQVGDARNHLGRFLFSGDDAFKKVGDLSGGERSRLALAKFALNGANFLVLDEPTNHLDIPSQEILEAVLTDFTGTILLVSHNRYFVDALATQVWTIEDKTIIPIEGSYRDYLAYRETQKLSATDASVKSAKSAHQAAKTKKRAENRQARAIAAIEETIAATEAKLVQLTSNIEKASLTQDIETLQELGREYQQTEARLAKLFDEWMSMEAA